VRTLAEFDFEQTIKHREVFLESFFLGSDGLELMDGWKREQYS
jgi:hypothetical protein